MSLPAPILGREDLIGGLNRLIAKLHRSGQPAVVRIVGGAAIALAYNSRRDTTVDIDARLEPESLVLDLAADVAVEMGWRGDWLNNKVEQFMPSGFGLRGPEWDVVYSRDGVEVHVATAETLLAMKCTAVQTRGVRDLDDLRALISITGFTDVDEVEDLYGEFYPGEGFTERTAKIVAKAIEMAAGNPSSPPPPVDLG